MNAEGCEISAAATQGFGFLCIVLGDSVHLANVLNVKHRNSSMQSISEDLSWGMSLVSSGKPVILSLKDATVPPCASPGLDQHTLRTWIPALQCAGATSIFLVGCEFSSPKELTWAMPDGCAASMAAEGKFNSIHP